MPQKPKLTFSMSVPHGVTVTSLRVWGTILDTRALMLCALPDAGKFEGTVEFEFTGKKLVIEILAVGMPNREITFNFARSNGKKVYATDQELLIKSNARGSFYDDQAIYPA